MPLGVILGAGGLRVIVGQVSQDAMINATIRGIITANMGKPLKMAHRVPVRVDPVHIV